MAGWVAELGVEVRYGREVTDFTQDDDGVDVRLAGGAIAASRATSSVATAAAAWSARPRASTSRAGTRPQLPDRGGRSDRGAPAGHPPRRGRRVRAAPHGGRQDVRVVVTRRGARAAGGADPGRSARGDDGRVRHRLRHARPHVDLALHRRDPAGRRPTATGACCWPATRRTSTTPRAGRGSALGVQDAVNLGWKLAQVVQGHLADEPAGQLPRRAPPGRRPCAANTMAPDGAERRDERRRRWRDVVSR